MTLPWTMRALTAVTASASFLFIAGVARSEPEPSPEDRSLATALFKEGRKLLELGQVAEACRKLGESQRLDPGGGTLLNLAACHEREGKTASAWAEFTEALGLARKDGRDDRMAVATERIAQLEPHLSRLTIVVAVTASSDVDVTLDGTPVRRAAWGMAVPVDPGPHTLEARAPGMRPWSASLTVGAQGDAQMVSVPSLEPAPAPPVPVGPPAERPSPPPLPSPATAPFSSSRSPPPSPLPWHDIAAVGAGVVGVAGVALGSYFGLHAISLENQAQGGCVGAHCSIGAAATSNSAATNADWSTGSFVAGAAGLGAAAILFFTRHPTAAGALSIEPAARGASVAWVARF